MVYDPANHEADLAIRVDAADVTLAKAGEVATGRLAVSVAGYLKDGRMEMFPPEELAPRLTAEQRETALREGIRVERRLVLAEDVEKLRVLVYDRESGAMGSLTVPLERRQNKCPTGMHGMAGPGHDTDRGSVQLSYDVLHGAR
jgi:hypothetical protein